MLARSANYAKARYGALLPMRKVCRLWYHIATPWLFKHIDMRHCTIYSYGAHHQLNATLANVLLPNIKKVQQTIVEAEDATSSTSSGPDAPASSLAETIYIQIEDTSPAAKRPLGHLVEKYTVGGCDSCLTYFISALQSKLTPKLREVQLQSSKHLKNAQLASMVQLIAGPKLRSLDHISVNATEDVSTRCESFLTLFNHAPNLERFGVMGEGFQLSEAYAKRLLFILKLNSTLKHRQTDALGVGLRHLYLGPGCSIPVSFLRGLKDSAPHLSSLHVKTGVKVLTDSNGALPFDLHAFVASFGSQLTALTLVGTEGFSIRGNLDEVLKVSSRWKKPDEQAADLSHSTALPQPHLAAPPRGSHHLQLLQGDSRPNRQARP